MSVNIRKWRGRLGNNITQIVNAIYFAEYFKIEKIIFPRHKMFNTCQIELKKYINEKQNDKLYRHDFFSRKKICKYYNIDESIFDNVNTKVGDILKKIFKIKYNEVIDLNDDDLVIHIRSGDVYNKKPHSGWIQPPLIFYEKIIDSKPWKRIFLICEDNKSPIIKPLLNKYDYIHFKLQPLGKDINYILQCKNICFGMGSFIPTLLLMNDHLNTIYYPSYCYRYVLDLVSYKVKKEYDLPNYIKKGEWKNTDKQILFMLNYTFK